MSLHDFLTFNNKCPICNHPLHLFMQWIDSDLYWAGQSETRAGERHFIPYTIKDGHGYHNHFYGGDRTMTILDYGSRFETVFGSPSHFNEAKRYQIYFYFLCNPAGFDSKNKRDYSINLSRGCYYRSTPAMEFVDKGHKKWELEYSVKEFSDLINKDESFCLKTNKDGARKFYMLNRDMENQTTKVWHYTITEKDMNDENFKPNILRIELPLIERPSMSNHQKIIDRMDAWILMS